MKKVILSAVFALACAISYSQTIQASFDYEITKGKCLKVKSGIRFNYYAKSKSLSIDSDDSPTESFNTVRKIKEADGMIRFYTEYGTFSLEKDGAGGFSRCIFIGTNYSMMIIYSNTPLIDSEKVEQNPLFTKN